MVFQISHYNKNYDNNYSLPTNCHRQHGKERISIEYCNLRNQTAHRHPNDDIQMGELEKKVQWRTPNRSFGTNKIEWKASQTKCW